MLGNTGQVLFFQETTCTLWFFLIGGTSEILNMSLSENFIEFGGFKFSEIFTQGSTVYTGFYFFPLSKTSFILINSTI